ncbi:methyltransferase [Devosia sp.]|uniref:class I SAM-dependent DNA methyltransferase n=1 Tax=Devosia sp. TaxID=1871048 RepID=UPI001AC52AF7|nr:methyltransferase [Devosia sp.]MBN9308694.1 methyltransferase domain-containing protein [Devosia sp.]
MQQIQYSSGDVVADRRAFHAAALAAERAFADAAEVMSQALEVAPQWVAGWSLLGSYREAAGDIAGAVGAWLELLRLDRSGVFGARLKLAAHGALADTRPEPAYVEALFDDYAPRFEQSLVDGLGYQIPDIIAAAVARWMSARGVIRFARAVDLGCGTGLMGERLRPLVGRLEGVDLSANMLKRAERKRVYDRLEKADLAEFLEREPAPVDLVVAADVFNYVGALDASVQAIGRATAPGGVLAFSLETHEGDAPARLMSSLRFQHAVAPTLALCERHGLAIVEVERVTVRMDRRLPVEGVVVVAEKA